ncbi:hypothetical protein AJ85_11295 [Alkalihalobacillus alcalophilus ATCC 27647 = CGMCC 1.3604]|uniref:DUF3918 domain-containing protein n=1 Tax=Alkalihalobacillus alcalophilus ATCC 27647 = CGMCC 1.3604 TaxID=1218173 RepID=A0A094XGV2_ALKAL|nr:DUF3918 family protein [Alkalihalobacillus alcalophilus]KGA98020.1 hypothetical protein BALCAV_0207005 [Alkalihalobacillus alcalophilus ATCC 27647 = CGMCC 1.3604]MED1561856.1 DUF3918 family protein [Alkalihalobacillus alcalophilus]THG90370.1 hypothetical protein AJ85_11295 [Alkalihalobacillus alcalophilus ATCC 27647 = CGMCC 1.3604]
MRTTAISSLVAIGIGAAAYSMTSRRNKKKVQSFMKPITTFDMDNLVDKKTWKKTKKKVAKMF